MLKTLKDLFDAFTMPDEESPEQRTHALELATAVLLVEVMRADPALQAAERQAVVKALHEKFGLPDDALARLVEQAEVTARNASDFYQFTSRINERLTHPQKIQVIENMWQVAYADAHLDATENHLISKVADLLYVTHGEYIGAKMRAKELAGLA
ncbi:MAG: TerB family tellurite resistance protein [Polaromonas sp.]|nr:TerB family tellurite resistance protein [Polaromonas sp.]